MMKVGINFRHAAFLDRIVYKGVFKFLTASLALDCLEILREFNMDEKKKDEHPEFKALRYTWTVLEDFCYFMIASDLPNLLRSDSFRVSNLIKPK